MMQSYLRGVFVAGWLVLFTIDTAHSQAEIASPGDSAAVPRALPISEIPSLTGALNKTILEVDQLVQRPKFIDEIEASLPLMIDRVDSSYLVYADSTKSYTYSQLDRAEAFWSSTSRQTNDWSERIGERITELEAKKQEVSRELAVANLTLTSTVRQDAPGEVVKSVEQVIERNAIQMNRLQEALNEKLRLQTSLTPTIAKINSGQVFLTNRREAMLNNLWQIHTDPIWRAKMDTANVFGTFYREYVEDVQAAYSFWQEDDDFRFMTPTFFFILATYLWFFRRRTRQFLIEQKEEVVQVRLLLKYPILCALFITFIFTVLVLEPISELSRLFSLIISVPALYIFYAVNKYYRKAQIWMFGGLMFFLQINIPLESTFAGRVLLLIVALALLAATLNVLIKKKYLIFKEHLRPYVLPILQGFAILMLCAILSNVLGALQLARLLTQGVVLSLLIAVIFYLSVHLLTDIVSAIMINSPLAKSNIVRENRPSIRQKAQRIISVLAFIAWLHFTMEVFGVEDMVMGGIIDFVTYSVKVGTIKISLWDIIAFFLTLQIASWISRFIHFILEEEVYVRTKTDDKGVTGTISLIIRYSVISLGVVLAFAAAGIEFNKLALLLGALGVGIGFGLQNIFNNLISGVILALERPMRIGDVVEVKTLMGTVQDIGFRASIVRSFDGADVIIPNGDFLSTELINWTRSDSRRRLEVNVGVAYGTDPEHVLQLLREAANEHDVVLKYPSPIARFLKMDDSSLNFQLLYWIPDFNNSFSMGTQVTTLVYQKITAAGIQIPFPQQDVHLYTSKDTPTGSGQSPNATAP